MSLDVFLSFGEVLVMQSTQTSTTTPRTRPVDFGTPLNGCSYVTQSIVFGPKVERSSWNVERGTCPRVLRETRRVVRACSIFYSYKIAQL